MTSLNRAKWPMRLNDISFLATFSCSLTECGTTGEKGKQIYNKIQKGNIGLVGAAIIKKQLVFINVFVAEEKEYKERKKRL